MSAPLTLVARMRAKPGQEARLRAELQRLVAPTHAEAGCLSYDLHISQSDPALFLFYETWRSQADLDAHFETPHLKALVKILPEMLEGEMELTKWTKW